MQYRLSYKLHLKVILTSIVFCIVCYDFLKSVSFNFYINSTESVPIKFSIVYMNIFIILIFSILALIHELIHGIAYKCFGCKVTYKLKWIYAATYEISEKPLSLTQFTIVLLAPATTIALFSLLFLPTWLNSFLFVINLLSSLGDIFMAFELIKYPCNSKIVDRNYGYDVIT